MKKTIAILIIGVLFFASSAMAYLTEEQRAEQRRQQQAAQRAYQASSNTYNEVSRKAGIYKEGAEITRDAVKQVTPSNQRERLWGWSNND